MGGAPVGESAMSESEAIGVSLVSWGAGVNDGGGAAASSFRLLVISFLADAMEVVVIVRVRLGADGGLKGRPVW